MVDLSTIPPHPQALGSPGAPRGCSRMRSLIPGAPGLGTGNVGSRWESDSPRQLQDFPGILWDPVNPDGLPGVRYKYLKCFRGITFPGNGVVIPHVSSAPVPAGISLDSPPVPAGITLPTPSPVPHPFSLHPEVSNSLFQPGTSPTSPFFREPPRPALPTPLPFIPGSDSLGSRSDFPDPCVSV